MDNGMKKDNRIRLSIFALCMAVFSLALCGCEVKETKEAKIKDVEFTLVEEEEIPEELLLKIEEKKAADMKLMFESGEYTYIVRGYGEQETGGYSIQILEFYQTRNAVVLSTNLLGPSKGSEKNKAPSFPYVVIKTKTLPETLVFD